MIQSSNPLSHFDDPGNSEQYPDGLRKLINEIQKEVAHVQEENDASHELQLRRLMVELRKAGGSPQGELPASRLEATFADPIVLPEHRAVLLHALAMQLHSFSGGALARDFPYKPLWLTQLLAGSGLRRMTPDYVAHADRLLSAFGLPCTEQIAGRYVSQSNLSARLAQFGVAQRIAEENGDTNEGRQMALRLQFFMEPTKQEVIHQIMSSDLPERDRIRFVAGALAQSAKMGEEPASALVLLLDHYVNRIKSDGTDETPEFHAEVINALNLVYLKQRRIEEVQSNLKFLGERVIPRIADAQDRDHIEGNYFYQKSIMRKVAGDTSSEIEWLLLAAAKDRHFATIYYRLAQILHDRRDPNADPFYRMALAVSPVDLPTANDLGCYLSDMDKGRELASWSAICAALFPEEFAGDVA